MRRILPLSMVYRFLVDALACEIRGAEDDELQELWRRGQQDVCAGTSPAAHVLAVAWRQSGDSTIRIRISRERTRGSSRWRLADALLGCGVYAWVITHREDAAEHVQVAAFDRFGGSVVCVEQSPHRQLLPGTRT